MGHARTGKLIEPRGDNAALLAIKAALGNPYHFASWTPDYTCCDWYDVDYDDSIGRVVGLSVFQDGNIMGTIPDVIAGLVHLQSLTWHHLPGISGPIPPAIAKLSNLSSLTISWNAISGPVSSFLGVLTKLTFLDLSFNSLTGTIPTSLAAIPNLSIINLSHTRLTGSIPPRLLSKSADQIYLWLSHNNLSGTLPAEFAAANFSHLNLSRNRFTGNAPGLFGRGKELQYKETKISP
ncbi:polygalacturonase inhibitor-like [Setaria italica]|uniref:polygalacturonase inhibitor-like n=1 Tax=Setaria italica TaxID=4555 RepID=UPI0003510945|nr:polygalacturonase inhibitor-like [Setaria italica]